MFCNMAVNVYKLYTSFNQFIDKIKYRILV